MKYRHFPAAVLAAGLFFCTLFSGAAACADDQRSELTQNQVETRQAYEDATAALDAYVRAQSQRYTTADLRLTSLDFRCPLDSYGRITTQFGEG